MERWVGFVLYAGDVTEYEYNAVGNLARTELPNGTSETRDFDELNRLVFLENRGPGGVISSYTYTLAATGRRDAVVEESGRRVVHNYDALDRLTGETITDAAAGNRAFVYTYDAVGNRLTRTDTVEGTTAYIYDANDRLLTETTGGAVTAYTYDDNGNTLTKDAGPTDRAAYTWDAEGRLVAADVTDASGTKHIANRYDADGIRVSQTVDGEETRYLIDAVQAYPQVLLEYRPGGLAVVSYVYGNDLISQTRGGAKSFYHVDGLGSTRALTDAAGVVTDRYVYEAFGRTIGGSGTTINNYLFAGEQRDAGMGLDYLRARYLSVGTGRFYGMDPFSGILAAPNTLNRFAYTVSDPVNKTDPSGRYYGSITDNLLNFQQAQIQFGRVLTQTIGFPSLGLLVPFKLPVYGNWGGPGHGGSVLNVPEPIDDLDAAFMRHDLRYQAHGYFNRRSDLLLIGEIDEALLHGHVLPLGRVLAPTIRSYFVFQLTAFSAAYWYTRG